MAEVAKPCSYRPLDDPAAGKRSFGIIVVEGETSLPQVIAIRFSAAAAVLTKRPLARHRATTSQLTPAPWGQIEAF
ncbi:hypothetical protein [Pseudarthrobacter sp. PS3-L1]|uniref:hypothetical protein n=1 Tax=Pseudarthrobacter sp. PS3-L1 TaxID=3046207 RepID=UPI0024B9C8CF|nr:hypothetical protein [Pseudarthrobacter sp. PS3-L1]MDJ0319924.1 hypothetical protein [Pseudarthrobacter sp. PS3-L1]